MVAGFTPTQQRIVDAALRCFHRAGVQGATIEDIAQEAALSRKTVYRLFGHRQALIMAILRQRFHEVLAALRRQLPLYASFAEAVVEGHLFAIRQLEIDPTFQDLIASESSHGVNPILMADPEIDALVRDAWLPLFRRARAAGEIRSALSDERLIAGGARMAAMLTLTRDVDEEGRRRFLQDFFVPAVVGLPSDATEMGVKGPE
jgi:AcrR family transcriptional regulator